MLSSLLGVPGILGPGWPGPSVTHARQCYKEDRQLAELPTARVQPPLNKLAQPLPMAHCAHSAPSSLQDLEMSRNENNPP